MEVFTMLPAMFRNTWFPTVFDDFDFTPRANTTAPAVNVMENETAYTMEVAAPGIKKEFCRVNINEDGNLSVAIENGSTRKRTSSISSITCVANSLTATTSRTIPCLRMWTRNTSLPRWRMAC
jgi:HSP20 family molecular chaperone IbpA